MSDDGWVAPGREATDRLTTDTASVVDPVLDSCFVVVLVNPQGYWLRRCYLSLHSATRAYERAVAAGHSARLVLCRLTPVEGAL